MTNPAPAAPRAPNPVLAVFGRGLETALNHALSLDPDTREALDALDGRAIAVEFRGTGLALRLAVQAQRLSVGPAFAAASDLGVTATAGSLLGMAVARLRGDADAVLPGKIGIAGDAELARRVERLLTRFDPDVDEAFARMFGDVAGFQLARAMRRAFAAARDAGSAFARDSADWLVEESRVLAARAEIEPFLDEVDALRERGDRLEARVRRLAAATRA